MRPCERFPSAGFTLLEVMAAVVVLGLVYIALARGAMQGLQTEGDASRRLRASLLADRVLNDLELSLAGGSAPALGEQETTEEEFTVLVEVSPFDVGSLLQGAAGQEGGLASPTSELQLLQPPARGAAPTLLSIAIRVAWTEGISEQEVTRTSFAFDLEAAAPLLEEIQARAQELGTPAGLQEPGEAAEPAQ